MSDNKKTKETKKIPETDERFDKVKFDSRFSKKKSNPKAQKIPSRLTSTMKNTKAFTNPIEFDKYGRKYEKKEEIELEENDLDEVASIKSSSTESYVEGYFDDEEEDFDMWSELNDENEGPSLVEPSARIAIENFDHRKIKAGDFMVLFHSFKPSKGVIKKISIHTTTFGKERMEIEKTEGPGSFLDSTKKPLNVSDEEYENVKLREYEKSLLKYHFAVVECDSKETADLIYQNLDGSEFELTGMSLKLSFVPAEMMIPNELVDSCKDLPEKINFDQNDFNRAIAHTNVQFSWDESMPDRKLLLSKAYDLDIENTELDHVFGGIEEDSDAEEEQTNKPELVIDEEPTNNWQDDFNKKKRRSSGIEITFKSGFDSAFEKDASKELKEIEKVEERKKEKRLKKRKGAKKVIEIEEDPSLQLLVDDEKDKEDFKLNLDDPRFSSLGSSKFAFDATSSKFKKEKMKEIVKEIKNKKIKLN